MLRFDEVAQELREVRAALQVYGAVEYRPQKGTFDVYSVQPTLLAAVNHYLLRKNERPLQSLDDVLVQDELAMAKRLDRESGLLIREFENRPLRHQLMIPTHGRDGRRWVWDRDAKGGSVTFTQYTVLIDPNEVVEAA